MFDFDSHIHMLELVLCSGRDERKTLDFVCWDPGCDFVDYYDPYMTHSLDGCDHT